MRAEVAIYLHHPLMSQLKIRHIYLDIHASSRCTPHALVGRAVDDIQDIVAMHDHRAEVHLPHDGFYVFVSEHRKTTWLSLRYPTKV